MAENKHDPIIHQLERAIDKNYVTDLSFDRASVEAQVAIANELARIAEALESVIEEGVIYINVNSGSL